MNSKKYLIGIDGGGTKTEMFVADSTGSIIESKIVGSTNHQSTDKVYQNFKELLSDYQGKEVISLVAFLSGWDFKIDQTILKGYLNHALKDLGIDPEFMFLENDIFAILKSGLATERSGACLISGTGTLGAALDGTSINRTYGFGYSSGEWGGGRDIGDEAMYQVFAAHQNREVECPILTDSVLKFFNVKDCDTLAEKVNHPDFNSAAYAGLVPKLFEAMKKGCKTSEKVLFKGGVELAKTAASQLIWVGQDAPLILGGGVFQHNGVLPGFATILKEKLGRKKQEIRLLDSQPALGSLLWAAELAKIETKEILNQIQYKRSEI